MKYIQYKIYNPDRDKLYVVRYEEDSPEELVKKITEQLHLEACGNKTGIVYDPEGKWKFEQTFEDKELTITKTTNAAVTAAII